MPEEFDFAELRKYLRGQIDMGDSEVFLDEPWTLVKRAAPAPSRPAINTAPSVPASAQGIKDTFEDIKGQHRWGAASYV